MAIYEDQYSEHPVHDVLSQLRAALRQKHKHKLDEVALDALDRLGQISSFIEQRLQQASPVLNSAGKLGNLQKGVQASLNELNQFLSNGNSGHLSNAVNQIDAAVNAAATLVTITGANPTTAAEDATSFKKLAETAIAQVNAEAESAYKKRAKFEEEVSAFEAKVAELQAQLEAVKSNVSSKAEELDSRYEAEKNERESEFSQFQGDFEQRVEATVKAAVSKSDDLLTEISKKKAEAEKIVQLVGNVGLTGNYKGAGDSEKSTADRLRNIALSCFVGTSLIVAYVLYLSSSGEFHIMQSVFRLGAALVLLIPGTYAAKESAKHRILETRHRRAELELASINAYLEDLPAEDRNKLKAALTERFFGQPVEDQGVMSDVAPATLIDLLKQAIGALSKK